MFFMLLKVEYRPTLCGNNILFQKPISIIINKLNSCITILTYKN